MKPVNRISPMKKFILSSVVACCGVAAFAQEFEEPQNDPLNAVVRIETVDKSRLHRRPAAHSHPSGAFGFRAVRPSAGSPGTG